MAIFWPYRVFFCVIIQINSSFPYGVYLLHNFRQFILMKYKYFLSSTKRCSVFLKEVLIADCFYSHICIPEIIYFGKNLDLIMLTLLLPVLTAQEYDIGSEV